MFIFVVRYLFNMETLINKNIGIQNEGLSEMDAWLIMLKKTQIKLFNAYKRKRYDLSEQFELQIDFIQKQIIRLSKIC
jgi:hypothetical protein